MQFWLEFLELNSFKLSKTLNLVTLKPTPPSHLHDALFDPIFVPIDAIFGLNKGWRKIKRPQKGLNSLNSCLKKT